MGFNGRRDKGLDIAWGAPLGSASVVSQVSKSETPTPTNKDVFVGTPDLGTRHSKESGSHC
jgi:hypothetical protein